MKRRSPITVRRVLIPMVAAAAASVSVLVGSAQAAPGDAFDPHHATIFIAQDAPTGLYSAVTSGAGTVTFNPEGSNSGLTYNAVGFDDSDGYIYGIALTGRAAGGAGVPAIDNGSLIRIGQDGLVTQVGAPGPYVAHVGAMYQGYLYINNGSTALVAIDVSTGVQDATRSKTLTDTPDVSDFTELGGYFWGITSTGQMMRINPADGQVDKYTTAATGGASVVGAAWTYGNGNLGFSQNSNGQVRQISVANPAAATPTFTLISTSPGPGTGNNDGTAAVGDPVDLSIVKTGPTSVVAGGTISYTLKVTNNGPGDSTGFTVSDTIPSGMSNPTSSDPGCTVAGDTVTCVGGALVSGGTKTYTITADVGVRTSGDRDNTATVTGNEADPKKDNDTSTFTTNVAPPNPELTVTKHAHLNDTNGNGLADKGETIDFSFTAKNTGNVDLTDVSIDDPLVTGIDPVSADIGVGDNQVFTADPYTVTADDVAAGKVVNSATASGTDPTGGTVTSDPSKTTTKTFDPDTTGGGGGGGAGDSLLPDTGAPAWMMSLFAAGLGLIASGALLARRRVAAGRHIAE